MNSAPDIDTLNNLRNGNHKAFEAVFLHYYPRTKAFIYAYIKSTSDAEELAEELFVNLWINRETIDLNRSFNSWLHTIARNAAINYLRNKYIRDAYVITAENSQSASTSEEELIAKELGLLIDDIVEKMPAQRRQIYELSRLKGLSNAEIAEKLNTTKRNVESQLSLALKEIRKAISAYFFTLL